MAPVRMGGNTSKVSMPRGRAAIEILAFLDFRFPDSGTHYDEKIYAIQVIISLQFPVLI